MKRSASSRREYAGYIVAAAWIALALCVLAYLASGFRDRFMGSPDAARAGRGVAVVASPAPAVTDMPAEWIVPPRPIKTYSAQAKAASKLPAQVQADDKAVVLEASTLPASDRPVLVTSVLNTETGETEHYIVEQPLPWLDTTVRGDAGLYVGLKHGEPTLRVQARAQLAQVKAVRLGALASADWPLNGERPGVQGDVFVGVGGWVQW